MAITMLKDANLANVYWKKVVNIVMCILNKVQIKVNHTKTSYKLWNGRPPIVKYFRIFRSKCYIKRDEDDHENFDTRNISRICYK